MKLRYKILTGLLSMGVISVAVFAVVLSHNKDCVPTPAAVAGAELMNAVTYQCYGSPEVLELSRIEKPTPADGEALVKVHSAAVNPLDWHYMRGEPYIMRLMGSGLGKPVDTRLGVDFAGTIESIGKNFTRFKAGDRVFGGRTGAFGEYVIITEKSAVAAIPDSISFEQAAAVPIAAITALQALRDIGGLKAGEKVLVNGASGGVGTYAVQIAKHMGAEVTGVCSARNADMVRSNKRNMSRSMPPLIMDDLMRQRAAGVSPWDGKDRSRFNTGECTVFSPLVQFQILTTSRASPARTAGQSQQAQRKSRYLTTSRVS